MILRTTDVVSHTYTHTQKRAHTHTHRHTFTNWTDSPGFKRKERRLANVQLLLLLPQLGLIMVMMTM